MKTTGMGHQLDALARSQGQPYFAFLMDMGTGKTWTSLADAEWLFEQNLIDAIMVAAPKGVHVNWLKREAPTHLSVRYKGFIWRGTPTSKKAKAEWASLMANASIERELKILSMNIDAFNTDKGRKHAEEFLERYRCVFIVDEATRIKNPAAKRTEHITKLGRQAVYRRILTGSPVTKGPLDLYAPFHFLKGGLLGTRSYRAFVSEYAVLVPPNSPLMHAIMAKTKAKFTPQVVQQDEHGRPMYRNIDQLINLMAPYVHRVRKEDCLDLPPKVREAIYFDLTPAQRKAYDRLYEDNKFATDLDIVSFVAIAARTKMKQVTSGFVNIKGEMQYLCGADNPREAALNEALDTVVEGSMIIWAMYDEEIEQVKRVCEERGLTYAVYVGATKADARERAIDDFQAKKVDVFIGNPAAAGIGLTLTAAETVIYYTCSYDLELRLQSEDRAHRMGQTKTVRYIDLIAEDTIDEDVMRSLSRKDDTARKIVDSDTLLSNSASVQYQP
ncbi:DEAD/DEAH box helicase [Aeromonas phage Gekk3-15]